MLARGRLRAAASARSTASASISRRSTCDRTPTSTSERGRIVRESRFRAPNISKLDEEARIALLAARLALAAPVRLTVPRPTREETQGELAIFRTARAMRQTYGKDAIGTCIISKAQGRLRYPGGGVLLKEVGLLSAPRALGAQSRAAVRDDRRPARLRRGHGSRCCPCRNIARCVDTAAASRR